jgi:hypothetical protein
MRIPARLPMSVVSIAWLMFVASFFLPATGSSAAPENGWQTFVASIELLLLIPWNIAIGPSIFLFMLFPFFNLAMLLAPRRLADWNAEITAVGFLCGGSLPWLIPRNVSEQLFVGFYLWDASFFVMAIGCILLSILRNQD